MNPTLFTHYLRIFTLICSTLLLLTGDLQAQTYQDGPIQLQMRVRDVEVEYDDNDPSDLAIQSPVNLGSFEEDELSFRFWGRDRGTIAGWQGGNCLTADLDMLGGGPDYTPDFNYTIFSNTYPGVNVPRFLDIGMQAHEDDVPSDFSFAGSATLCGNADSRCAYINNICCINLFGCIYSEGDDYYCEGYQFGNQEYITALNYRFDSLTSLQIPPCEWYDHGYLRNGDCVGSNNEFYNPRIETYWRYTRGYGCNNAIDLGTFTAGSTINHYNSINCYNNNWPASPGNDVTYSFTATGPIGFTASLCGQNGAQFDSYLYFLNSSCQIEASNDNGCGNQSIVSAYICQPGTYYLVVDATTANAVGTFNLSIVEDSSFLFQATINKTDVQCFGAADGTAKVVATGGYPGYTYQWSANAGGGTTDSVGGLGPGTYTVTVTDTKGCTIDESVTITEPTELLTAMSSTNVSCSGAEDGTATVVGSGGTPPYTYIWGTQPFQVTSTAEFLGAGTYNVTVIDGQNCVRVDSVTVGTSTVISITVDGQTDVTCFGDDDGTVSISVSGGVTPYDYAWSHGPTTDDVTGLAPGTYYVTVYDLDSCFAVDSFEITEPDLLEAFLDDTVDVTCNGGSNGIVTTTITGGTPPYQYLWSNGFTSQNLLNVPAGSYTLTVTDDNGCEATVSHTINEPTAIAIVWNTTDPACFGDSTGAIDITVSGGTPPYSYLWSNGDTTEDLVNIPAGAYGVAITDSFSCLLFEFNALVQNPPVQVQITSVTDVDCNATSTGSISLNVTGGLPPYTFQWGNPLATGQNPGNLQAGVYPVTVVDQLGCTDTVTAIVDEPDALVANVVAIVNVSCNGDSDGIVQVDVTGGTQPYTYSWTNTTATTEDLVNVSAGSYDLQVTDANGCIASASAIVTEPNALSILWNITNPGCAQDSTGALDITVSGGTPPYSYLWNTGATTQDLNNIPTGAYAVSVSDSLGCFLFEFNSVTSFPLLQVSVNTVTDVDCNGLSSGSISLDVSGGQAPYTFAWSNPLATGQNPNGLQAGLYAVTVTDQQGCTDTTSAFVDEPALLTVSMNVFDVSCFQSADGSIEVDVTGGAQPYTYSWSNGAQTEDLTNIPAGTYDFTVTDDNGCSEVMTGISVAEPSELLTTIIKTDPSCGGVNDGSASVTALGGIPPYTYRWNTGAITQALSNIGAGNYTVIVTDANGCTSSDTISLIVSSPINITSVITDLECSGDADGEIVLTITGGAPPFTFNWSPNVGNSSIVTGLSGGTYDLTITDNNGCSATGSWDVFEPDEIILSLIDTEIRCFGDDDGVSSAVLSGGVPPFTYAWSDGQTTPAATDLGPGAIALTVTDNNGCTTDASTTIVGPEEMVASASDVLDATCFDSEDGSVVINVTGGTPDYEYAVQNVNFQTDPIFTNLPAGEYTALILDGNNCKATTQFTIAQPEEWEVTFEEPYYYVARGASVLLTPILPEGIVPVAFNWTPAISLDCSNCEEVRATPVNTTNYTVVVTDENGCEQVGEVSVIVKNGYELFLPNAFSPNGDGKNDSWAPIDFGSVRDIDIKIFNRWGAVVFTSNSIADAWDGTFNGEALNSDTYVFQIKGSFLSGDEFEEAGSIALIR